MILRYLQIYSVSTDFGDFKIAAKDAMDAGHRILEYLDGKTPYEATVYHITHEGETLIDPEFNFHELELYTDI